MIILIHRSGTVLLGFPDLVEEDIEWDVELDIGHILIIYVIILQPEAMLLLL